MYIGMFFLICILVVFYRIGQFDNEIGSFLGLSTGILVCAITLITHGSYLSMVLYSLGGFGFLTAYKILRDMTGNKKN
jgi:hypothetical protein